MTPAGAGAQPRWWEREPGRLEYEIQALRDAGFSVTPDEESFASGVARLTLRSRQEGIPELLVVTFPDLYPYFRFEIEAPEIEPLEHHQHPFSNVLCVLGRSTLQWDTTDTVASIIREQMPRVMNAGAFASDADDPTERAVGASLAEALGEEEQAEPFSEYYSYWPAMVVVDGSWRIPPDVKSGTLRIGILAWQATQEPKPKPLVHGVVLSVMDDNGHELERAAEGAQRLFEPGSNREVMNARWVRRDAPYLTDDPKEVFSAAAALDPHPSASRAHTIGMGGPKVSVYGTLYPEEVGHRHKEDRGWLFAVLLQVPAAAPKGGSKFIPHSNQRAGAGSDGARTYYLARTGRGGPADVRARAPELGPLQHKAVLVAGVGCLGAPSALEFARAGVRRVRMLDDDFVDPATMIRWPFGLVAAGAPKVAWLGGMMQENFPFTEVEALARRLGGVHTARNALSGEEMPSDYDLLAQLTEDVSLIYDASAEFGVQYFLSEYARQTGIAYLSVSATPGGWGGRVIRVRPSVTEGCWACVEAAFQDGSLPEPPADPSGWFQAEGCGAKTYVGANFELGQIAAQGVRLAISTLCEGAPGGFPSADWDVAIISMREPDGRLKPTTIETFPLSRHPACPVCAARSVSAP